MTDTPNAGTPATDAAQKGALHLTEADFEKTINESGLPVLVDFYADWCGPCKMAAPIIDRLADELRGKIVIAKLDTDESGAIAQQYGVMSIPTVIILQKKDDKIVELDRKIGFGGEEGYRQMINKVVPNNE
jgi:thioredoxin 1